MEDKFWYLKNSSLFERLSADEVARLEGRSRVRSFKRGDLIYLPSDSSDSVLLLSSGRVKIYHITSDGKQALLAIMDEGELFGELAVFDNGQREEFAEAMEAATVILIPGSEIRRLMEEHADVSLGVTKLMGLRRRRVDRRLKSLLFQSNRDRIVHLLVDLAEKYGRPTTEGLKIDIKLSHQDLASIIGSTRETVTVLLGELQSEGSLLIKRRQIVLTQAARLAESVDLKPPDVSHREDLGTKLLRQGQYGS